MARRTENASGVILVVEDDLGDQILIREALEASGVPNRIFVVRDGEEALEYLYRAGRYAYPAPAPRPNLILLDLNMPRLNGWEVVERVKADPELRLIPVAAFTTSSRDEDVARCYRAGVNSFVQKPTNFDQLQEMMQRMASYWLEVCVRWPREE